MCRYAKRFDTVKILFLIAGHTKNAQDQLNSYVSYKYSKGEFYSIDQMARDLSDAKRKFSTQCRVMDWNDKFNLMMQRYPQIFKAHVFKFTSSGMKTKEFADDPEWNVWNNSDAETYHTMLKECPTGLVQPMKPYQLSDTKKQDIQKSLSYVPPGEQTYLQEMMQDSIGYHFQALDCLNDFKSVDSLTIDPAAVPLHFRTKAKHAHTDKDASVLQTGKRTPSETSISHSEIRDLLVAIP